MDEEVLVVDKAGDRRIVIRGRGNEVVGGWVRKGRRELNVGFGKDARVGGPLGERAWVFWALVVFVIEKGGEFEVMGLT